MRKVAAVALVLVACGASGAGDVLVDAGQVLIDAGHWVDAATSADAQAAPPPLRETYTAGCEGAAFVDVRVDMREVETVQAVVCGGVEPDLPCRTSLAQFSDDVVRVGCAGYTDVTVTVTRP